MQTLSYRVEYLENPQDFRSVRAVYFAHDRPGALRKARAISAGLGDRAIYVIRAEIDTSRPDFSDTGHVIFRFGRLSETIGIYR
jgi:hypothetical protein